MRSSYTPTQPVYVYHPPAAPRWWVKALIAFAIGLLLFALLLPLLPAYFNNKYAGRIYPGVSVGGIDLSGLRPEQAMALLAQNLDYPERGRVVFTEGAEHLDRQTGRGGPVLRFRAQRSDRLRCRPQGQYLLTRLSNQYQAWREGVDLTPWLVYDEAKAQDYLKAIIAQIEKPVIEASLTVDGINVVVNSGQVGRSVDLPAALMQLQAQLPTLTDGIIPLIVHETSPVILDASAQAEIARKILSAPLVISVPDPQPGDPGPWTFDQKTLASMLTIEKVNAADGTRYQVSINSANLRAFLDGIAPNFLRYPQNGRFIFNDDTRQLEVIQHAVIGRNLDVDASLQTIVDKVSAGEHNLSLVIQHTQPAAPDDVTAEKLGIKELVVSYTSYFRGSSAERIQNIATRLRPFPRRAGGARRDLLDGQRPRRCQPGQRLCRSADHLRRPHDQRRGRRCVPGEHHPVPHGFLRRLTRSWNATPTPTAWVTTNRPPMATIKAWPGWMPPCSRRWSISSSPTIPPTGC